MNRELDRGRCSRRQNIMVQRRPRARRPEVNKSKIVDLALRLLLQGTLCGAVAVAGAGWDHRGCTISSSYRLILVVIRMFGLNGRGCLRTLIPPAVQPVVLLGKGRKRCIPVRCKRPASQLQPPQNRICRVANGTCVCILNRYSTVRHIVDLYICTYGDNHVSR